jgi:hypothetical protein
MCQRLRAAGMSAVRNSSDYFFCRLLLLSVLTYFAFQLNTYFVHPVWWIIQEDGIILHQWIMATVTIISTESQNQDYLGNFTDFMTLGWWYKYIQYFNPIGQFAYGPHPTIHFWFLSVASATALEIVLTWVHWALSPLSSFMAVVFHRPGYAMAILLVVVPWASTSVRQNQCVPSFNSKINLWLPQTKFPSCQLT